MRVVAYYRVSSAQQRDRGSIAGQRAEVRALVAANGWTLVAEYEDDGRSARKGLDKRTGLAATLARVRAREADAVVFVAFDRLSRSESVRERGAILGDFQEAGCRIVVSGGRLIDLATFPGRVEANLLLELAAEESAEKARRTKRGRARAARDGRNPGKAPFGYCCERGAWSAPGAVLIVEAYERVAAGETLSSIAGRWNARGLKAREGGRWNETVIGALVRQRPGRENGDPYVTGLWFGQRGEPAIAVPAIVSPELAALARAALASRVHRPPTRTKYVMLLDEHAARCGICGGFVRVVQSRGRLRSDGTRARFAYYACENRSRAGAYAVEPCTLPHRRTERVDEAVWRAVLAWAEGGAIVEAAASPEERTQATLDVETYRRQHAEAVAALDVLAERLGDGAISADAYRAQSARVAARRDLLARQIATWTPTATASPSAADRARVRMQVAGAREAPPAARRELVRHLFPAWVLDATGVSAVRPGARVGEHTAPPERIAVAC